MASSSVKNCLQVGSRNFAVASLYRPMSTAVATDMGRGMMILLSSATLIETFSLEAVSFTKPVFPSTKPSLMPSSKVMTSPLPGSLTTRECGSRTPTLTACFKVRFSAVSGFMNCPVDVS